MTGIKGRRAGAAEYAPVGTSPGDVQSVQADGTLAYGPPGASSGGDASPDPAIMAARQAFEDARVLVNNSVPDHYQIALLAAFYGA